MQLIDGKQTAALIKAEIAKEVESLVKTACAVRALPQYS